MELDNLSQMNSAGHRQQKLYYSFLNETSRICIITEIEGRLVIAGVRGSRAVFQLCFYCCEDTMADSTYRTKSLLGLAVSVSKGESMVIMVESLTAGRHGIGAVPGSSHLDPQQESSLGMLWDFEHLETHLLIPPKQFHHQQTTHSNT